MLMMHVRRHHLACERLVRVLKMPRLSAVFALIVPLVAVVLVFRSFDVAARLQLSWPLALHPDAQDDTVQVPVDASDSAAPIEGDLKLTNVAAVAGTFKRSIVAVGDLHGDLPNAYEVLKMAGVITEEGRWSGEVDFFVQTGDIIDR